VKGRRWSWGGSGSSSSTVSSILYGCGFWILHGNRNFLSADPHLARLKETDEGGKY
jgi:hypothetical protein